MKLISMENRFRSWTTKLCLKTEIKKWETPQKITSKRHEINDFILGEISSGAARLSKPSGWSKISSHRSQSAPKNEKETKRAETPSQNELTISKKQRRDSKKEPKVSSFRSRQRCLKTTCSPLEKHTNEMQKKYPKVILLLNYIIVHSRNYASTQLSNDVTAQWRNCPITQLLKYAMAQVLKYSITKLLN